MRLASCAIPLEYDNIRCFSIDITIPAPESAEEMKLIHHITTECTTNTVDKVTAYRGNYRWLQTVKPIRLDQSPGEIQRLKPQGVYLITGGFGGMGFTLAEYLARTVQARLALIGRSPFPPREEWDHWLKTQRHDDSISAKIKKIRQLETQGAEIMVFSADISNPQQVQEVVIQTQKRLGQINGVLHTAGIADYAGVIQKRTRGMTEAVMAPKVTGTLVLHRLLKDVPLDFFILFSSVGNQLYGLKFGQVAYNAANEFLDAFAFYRNTNDGRTFTAAINWTDWLEVGMSVNAVKKKFSHQAGDIDYEAHLYGAVVPSAGVQVFERILGNTLPRVILSTQDLISLMQAANKKQNIRPDSQEAPDKKTSPAPIHQRPELTTEYAPPTNEIEQALVNIWQQFFGIEPIGVFDEFFELGGDSLKAMALISVIRKDLNARILLADFFNGPTIRGISGQIGHPCGKEEYSLIKPVEVKNYFTVTSAQRRLYVIHQMEPDDVAYNQVLVVTLEGRLDGQKIEDTFRKMIRRHESLRTSFEIINGQVIQKVKNEIDFSVEYFDLHEEMRKRTTGRDQWLTESLQKIQDEFVKPFDLSQAPLLRAALLRTAENLHMILIDLHHIISDGTSNTLFNKEFMALYKDMKLPGLRIQYKDYAEWQNSQDEKGEIRQQQDYWLEQFEDEVPVLNLPADYKRPVRYEFAGRVMEFCLGKEKTTGVKKLARDESVTLFTIFLAIYNILLSNLSGQEDIVIGTPVAGRRHADLKSIIGMFVNTLALRNYPVGNGIFKGFLQEIKSRSLAAFENQEYPYEDIIEQIKIKKDLSRNPLFDVMLIFQNIDVKLGEGNGNTTGKLDLEMSSHEYDKKTARFDLTFTGIEVKDDILWTVEYRTKLFKPETIERFIGYFNQLVSSVVKNPTLPIKEIDMMSAAEKTQLLDNFNETLVDFQRSKTLHQLFEEQVNRTPHRVAVVYKNQKITFNELNKRSNQVSHLLRRKGIKPNDIVGIMTDRSIEMVLGLLSVLKAGGSYLPIVPGYPGKRIKYMLKDSDVNVILVNVDKSFEDEYCLIHLNDMAKDQEETSNPSPLSVPADLAYVIYTSGTTGNPKGVMISNQSVVNFIKGITDDVVFAENDTILSLTTISFDIFGLEVILPLTRGTRMVMGSSDEQLNPGAIAAAVKREKVSIFQLTPSRLQIIISNENAAKSLKRLKYLLVGGEAFPDALLNKAQRLTGARIFNVYGPTETTIWSAIQELTERIEVNIGRPMANTRIYILSGENKMQPLGVTGELCIAGVGVGEGYLNRVELTTEKFVADPFYKGEIMYRTGDLARWLPNGELMFLGRIDHQVKVRGYRIEMAEIENHLQKYPQIKEAVVTAMEGNDGKYLCAYLVPSPSDSTSINCRKQLELEDNEKSIDTAQLREYLAKELPPYMLPSYFVELREFPLSPNGKVDRKRLPKPAANALSDVPYQAPTKETEEKLVEVWQEVFEIEKIGINNDFFEMGGHSLKAIEIASRLEKYGLNITIDDIFRFSTIKKIAEKIDLNLNLINSKKELINDLEEAEFSLKNQFGTQCRLLKYNLPYKNYFVLFMEEEWAAEMDKVMDFIQSNWREEIFPSYMKKLDKDIEAANSEIMVSEKEFNMLFNLKN